MTSQPLPENWTDDATWLVQAMDPNVRLVRLLCMDAARYREASFLDDRVMPNGWEARLCSLDEAMAAADGLPDQNAGWIFHIGHVGSTLVSRLLGELDGVLAIREPRSLRDLLAFSPQERPRVAANLRKLMARPLGSSTLCLVKATSFVSEMAAELTGQDAPALFLFASPRNYIASILAGPNSTLELRALAQHRKDRLSARGIMLDLLDSNDAHLAAFAWLTEMASLEAAAQSLGDRVMWFDFDQMLGDMPGALGRCAAHFGVTPSPDEVREIAEGPLMRRYSKAMEYDYSPSLRRDLLAEADRDHGEDLGRAMDWLYNAAGRHPLLAAALARST